MHAATIRQTRVLRGVGVKVEYGEERSGTRFGVCDDGDGANGIPTALRYPLQIVTPLRTYGVFDNSTRRLGRSSRSGFR